MTTKSHVKTARLAGLTLSIALIAGAIASAVAADIPTGKGGANLLTKAQAPAGAPAPAAMSCPMCKSEYMTRKDLAARGAIKPTVVVERHLCKGCHTTLATAGTGKAKTTVAMHQCTASGLKDLACCESK